MTKNIVLAFTYFLLSTIITWCFIKQGRAFYFSQNKMFLSYTIAGIKWCVQIISAYFFLNEKKWIFIKRIAFTSFVGSCILLPYCFFSFLVSMPNSFFLSLLAAVLTMIILYFDAVKNTGISVKWFWGWMFCLSLAISLQLFVVFKILSK